MEPITIGIAAVTALVTGITSYFVFKPSGNNENSHVDSKGEIYNNVQLAFEQNNVQNGVLVLTVGMLVVMKMIEFFLYIINAHKRSLKKKYQPPTRTLGTPAAVQQV